MDQETGGDAGRRHPFSDTCVWVYLSCQWWPASARCGLVGWDCWWLSACCHSSPMAIWTLRASHTRESEPLCPPGRAHTAWTHTLKGVKAAESQKGPLSVSHLIVEVVNLQLIAPSTVGEVETAVFFGGEQLCVLMLLKRSQVKAHTRAKYEKETSNLYFKLSLCSVVWCTDVQICRFV